MAIPFTSPSGERFILGKDVAPPASPLATEFTFGTEKVIFLAKAGKINRLRRLLSVLDMDMEEFSMHACVNFPRASVQKAIEYEMERRKAL